MREKSDERPGSAAGVAFGTGFSRIFDFQLNRFIAVSCTRCGYTEFYNPRVLGDQEKTTDVLDVIFGR